MFTKSNEGKSTESDHNLISSEVAHDTSAFYISGHSSQPLPRKFIETPNLTCFTKSKCRQMSKNQQTVTII